MPVVRCQCFKPVRLREDETPEHALDNHRFSGQCSLVERPKPLQQKKRKTEISLDIDKV